MTGSVSASAKVLYTDNMGMMHIILYLNKGGETYNFNDFLVAKRYAVPDETDGQVAPGKVMIKRDILELVNIYK